LTGQKPFPLPPDANWLAWAYHHKTQQPAAPSQLNSQVPVHIEQAILKAMAKEHNERHADVATFIAALRTPPKSKEQWLDEGNAHYRAKRFQEALAAYDRAIQLDPNNANAYYNKGNALSDLKRYQEGWLPTTVPSSLTLKKAYFTTTKAIYSHVSAEHKKPNKPTKEQNNSATKDNSTERTQCNPQKTTSQNLLHQQHPRSTARHPLRSLGLRPRLRCHL
jgi:hypothetical protein